MPMRTIAMEMAMIKMSGFASLVDVRHIHSGHDNPDTAPADVLIGCNRRGGRPVDDRVRYMILSLLDNDFGDIFWKHGIIELSIVERCTFRSYRGRTVPGSVADSVASSLISAELTQALTSRRFRRVLPYTGTHETGCTTCCRRPRQCRCATGAPERPAETGNIVAYLSIVRPHHMIPSAFVAEM
jgi:hypothetical protein